MERYQQGQLTRKKSASLRLIAILSCALLLISLVPMLVVAFDNRPYFDDFAGGGRVTHQVWQETGSVAALLTETFETARQMYDQWEGNFVANHLNAIQFGAINLRLSFLTTFVMLTALIFAAYQLSSAVFVNLFRQGKAAAWVAAVMLTFVSVQFVPYPNEAFFWQSGAVKYTLAHATLLLTAATAIRLTVNDSSKHVKGETILLCALAFLCGGFNLMTGIATALMLSLYTALLHISKGKGRFSITLGAAAVIIAYTINMIAPGNAVRSNHYLSPSPLRVIAAALYATLEYVGRWTTLESFALVLLIGFMAWHSAKTSQCSFRHPMPVLLGTFVTMAAELAPPIYAGAYYDTGRIVNTVYLTYCLFLFVNAWYLAGWLCKKNMRLAQNNNLPEPEAQPKVAALQSQGAIGAHNARGVSGNRLGLTAATLAVCVTLLFVGGVGYGLKKMTGGAALYALLSGQSTRYAQAYDERARRMEDETSDTVAIAPITDVPLVFMNEEGSWKSILNIFSQYYQKNIVNSSD